MTLEQQILESFKESGNKAQVARDLGIDVNRVKRTLRQISQPDSPARPDWQQSFIEWAKANNHPIPAEFQEQAASSPVADTAVTFPSSAPVVYWPKKFKRIVTVSDVHLRYEDKVAVQLVFKLIADLRPDAIVLAGDIYDFYPISDFDRDPGRSSTIQDEFDEGRYFIKAIDGLTPNVFYIEGNHEERLFRLIRRNPGLYKLRSLEFRQAAELPAKWQWFPDQTHLHIDGCAYMHGNVKGVSERVAHPASTLYRQLKISLICGHFHRTSRHWEVHYHGGMDKVTTNGHLSDVRQAKYIVNPRWQKSITMTEYGGQGFEHYQFFVENDVIIAPGREYML